MNKLNIKNICVLDTSIATANVGDEIIMDAVNRELYKTFPEGRFLRIPTHERIYKASISYIRKSDYTLLGGSNILSSEMNKYRQWKIALPKALLIKKKVITMGVGWREYQTPANGYTRKLLSLLLNDQYLHSVRDSYTENYLKEIGIHNVINTSCPTMWELTPAHCEKISRNPSDTVVFTLTDYKEEVPADTLMVNTLLDNFKNVYFWVQGKNDLPYLKKLDLPEASRIQIIPPSLRAYDAFLDNNDTDYVGTRLHGGIRALQKKKRSLIVGIDNRAIEKKKDFNVPVLERAHISALKSTIQSSFSTQINLPMEKINTWKQQFV
ncbi:MAG TPA: polysaccharide pyruvyl transferase family protein [Flavobacteriaceae bacterium]|nr:polysaccharide pyruvyl transferase family protein [Flavobacteriaceae bacterium]MCB9213486.1 polysaccharide pyruvyl transferase family protein [Alteromonas sp.]HPF12211.1 polysaccharide pyruvyl transferase family protein [Flavobacteriaceae bacterium]HQU22002.1 polysaccharide pyruvyl transferase family protein [Flavobacteriaceae bacterium]HQU65901.1 polysaccharide pyruvyl transferase family protein [Flavobacteriaceae bacterium]